MRWFRDTLRQGSWLALIALAINLGLSFGHIHAIGGKVSGRGIAALAASVFSPDDGLKQGQPGDGHTDYLCPICMAATAMATLICGIFTTCSPVRINQATLINISNAG